MPDWSDPNGYAVDSEAGVVHRRYAEHAIGLPRTRSLSGVAAHLRGRLGEPCPSCFDVAPAAPKRSSRRRVAEDLAVEPPPVELPTASFSDEGMRYTFTRSVELEDADPSAGSPSDPEGDA